MVRKALSTFLPRIIAGDEVPVSGWLVRSMRQFARAIRYQHAAGFLSFAIAYFRFAFLSACA